jgi:predicted RNA-binding protein with RPS1 domain
VLAVLENLVDSMSKEDPRLKSVTDGVASSGGAHSSPGNPDACKVLPRTLSEAKALEDAVSQGPVRGVVGTVRNVADFGVFIDIGSENDGLLHVSKLGPSLQISNILIGERIGVDILSASNGKVSLGLHGCNFDPTSFQASSTKSRIRGASSSSSRKNGNSISGQKRSHHTKSSTDGRKKKQKTSHSKR